MTASCGTLRTIDEVAFRRTLRELATAFDCVHFGDNPRARASISPWAAAAVAIEEGLDPVVNITCRDRNRLALEADIMGGRLLGVRNLLCLRGDEIEAPEQSATRAVRHLDVVELLRLAHKTAGADACLLAACDLDVRDDARLFARLAEKVQAGASLLETQPVFDVEHFAGRLHRLREAGVDAPLLIEVFVLSRPEQAAVLRRIPSVRVPDDLESRIGPNGSGTVPATVEAVHSLRALPGVAGCHLMQLGSGVDAILEVAARLGIRRPAPAGPPPSGRDST